MVSLHFACGNPADSLGSGSGPAVGVCPQFVVNIPAVTAMAVHKPTLLPFLSVGPAHTFPQAFWVKPPPLITEFSQLSTRLLLSLLIKKLKER